LSENLAVEEASCLGHSVWSALRRGRGVHRVAELAPFRGSVDSFMWRAPSKELAVDKLLDDRSERDSGEEGEAADDHDDADHEAHEHAVVGAEGAERLATTPFAASVPASASAGIMMANRPTSMSMPPMTL